MIYPENNHNNRTELAEKIVSSWSREELADYVAKAFYDDYYMAPDIFDETWDDFKDSFEWSEELRERIEKDCPNPGRHCGACEKQD